PYAAASVCLDEPAATGAPGARLTLSSGGVALTAVWDGRAARLDVTAGDRTTTHRSRRMGRPKDPPRELGLALTGTHVTVLTRGPGPWTARARVDLRDLPHRVDPRDEAWLAGLTVEGAGELRAGGFGQLGLRDIRLVTNADGTAYFPDDPHGPVLLTATNADGTAYFPDDPHGPVLLTATSAGPGFFDTAHTSVWSLDRATLGLTHRADLFFRRPDRPGAYGDHAVHLVRDDGRWLVAASTWGDFDSARPGARVDATLATSAADLTIGRHLLDTEPLPLPTTGLRSVGVWDPHLVRTDAGWLVGYVSATRFFAFHPVVAAGPSLSELRLRAAAADRTATEGTTLARVDGEWRVLASDGRDNPRGRRRRYPVWDLDLRELGTLDAPYPSNIPWPTLVPDLPRPDGEPGWLLVGFDGRAAAGPLPGYGTHGDVVIARSADAGAPGPGR
ncbi:MAG: hypothetical protein HOQ45_02650, partial [Nocardioidaceae bacterium]|nr:hypothetical protein [Nocardioidaceae bacterium]